MGQHFFISHSSKNDAFVKKLREILEVGLLAQQKIDEIQPLFNQIADDPDASDSRKAIVQAMVSILNGSRDRRWEMILHSIMLTRRKCSF